MPVFAEPQLASACGFSGAIVWIEVRLDYTQQIERVYDHIEHDSISNAVMGCLRIARHLRDYLNVFIFLRELYPDRQEFTRVVNQDTSNLKPDVRKLLIEQSGDYFIATHTLPSSLNGDDSEERVLVEAIGVLDTELAELDQAMADMSIPAGMAPFDTAMFFDKYAALKSQYRLRKKAVQIIRDRIKTRCLNYAITIEKQIEAQRKSEAFLQSIQNSVNNYFRAHSEDVYTKLLKAAQFVDSTDPEDSSLLLTLIRRSINAVADFFYPPVEGSSIVRCSDGVERSLGKEQYLNRLHEYIMGQFPVARSSADLIRAEAGVLMTLARKLTDKSSKGVHADVTPDEAKQGLFALYMLLYNLIAKLQQTGTPSSPSA